MHPFTPKHILYYALAAVALCLLCRRWIRPWNRNALLLAAFIMFGGALAAVAPALEPALALHPSPMCAVGRLLQSAILNGCAPQMLVVSLGVILGLSLVARKLFCGWVCPLGALQELVHAVPWPCKARPLPFALTNSVRVYLLAVTVLVLVLYGVYLYEPINAFELLHWELDATAFALGLGPLLVVSLFYYRPFCYLVCPVGLLTWLLERLAPLGIRIDPKRCISCRACLKSVPCPALEPMVNARPGPIPDCTSCGLCIPACREGAIRFGLRPPRAPG